MQIVALVHAGAGDTFIRIDVNQLVLRMSSLVVLVVSDLCGEGVKLVFAVTGYSAASRMVSCAGFFSAVISITFIELYSFLRGLPADLPFGNTNRYHKSSETSSENRKFF
jgi:hypothetical protein